MKKKQVQHSMTDLYPQIWKNIDQKDGPSKLPFNWFSIILSEIYFKLDALRAFTWALYPNIKSCFTSKLKLNTIKRNMLNLRIRILIFNTRVMVIN